SRPSPDPQAAASTFQVQSSGVRPHAPNKRAAFYLGTVLPAAFGWTGFALGAAGLANRRALPAAAFALSVIALLAPLQIPYARYASPLLPPHLRAPVPTLAGSSRPWGELVGKGATGWEALGSALVQRW